MKILEHAFRCFLASLGLLLFIYIIAKGMAFSFLYWLGGIQ